MSVGVDSEPVHCPCRRRAFDNTQHEKRSAPLGHPFPLVLTRGAHVALGLTGRLASAIRSIPKLHRLCTACVESPGFDSMPTNRAVAQRQSARCNQAGRHGAIAGALLRSELPKHAAFHRSLQGPPYTQNRRFPWGQNLRHAQTYQSLEIRSASVTFSQKWV